MTFSSIGSMLKLFKIGSNEETIPLLTQESIDVLYDHSIGDPSPVIYLPHDLTLYESIETKVRSANLNNMTRTTCYLDFFKRNPEIPWSFLAHMVSRNAGYLMTDLRSNLLSQILSKNEQKAIFSFLDLCNAAIFQDAYPQLLLYEQWKKTGNSSFHLLRKFNISQFMTGIWKDYLTSGNKRALTVGLIMNEQHMIQRRIVSNQKNMGIEKWLFLFQDRLQFTSILFPYGKRSPCSLAGLSVSHFEQVKSRIQLGKKLYSILFHEKVFPTAYSFALKHPHSGSREDYWPHIYSSENKNKRLYSPTLRSVWDDAHPYSISPADWFTDQSIDVMEPLLTLFIPGEYSMTKKWRMLTSILMNLKRD